MSTTLISGFVLLNFSQILCTNLEVNTILLIHGYLFFSGGPLQSTWFVALGGTGYLPLGR